MDEVRSYWQVASISHFCTIFGKSFKLPTFEPEDLEQAFILDIPSPIPTTTKNASSNNSNIHESDTNNINHTSSNNVNNNNSNNTSNNDTNNINSNDTDDNQNDDDDPDWLAPVSKQNGDNHYQVQAQSNNLQPQQPEQEQQELHLLVKLAIALLKPHFNCKISHANWENYLRRIVESNWVELEHHPSPFRVPLVSQDGIELTKNLVFNELPLSDKIDLFFALCDYRLWCEDAAEALKDFTLEELRLTSIGKDSQGYEYWYFSGTRLFRENKELSQDIIMRKKRIKELEYKLVELEKERIIREQEEKRKIELDRAKQLAAEAREARLVAKKQQEQAANKRRKQATPVLPPRTGLRERRSSATSNNNDSLQTRTTRSRQTKQPQAEQQQQATPKSTRSLAKNSKHNDQRQDRNNSPDLPRKSPEEECKDELERLTITSEDRAEAWCIQCESLEDWETFAAKFEKTKSTNEKYLSNQINETILPKIRAIYAKRAAEVKRKEKELILSLASRRVSTRIISKRAQEEEEERQAQLHEAETRRKKIEAEARLRAELEREHRAKANRDRFAVNGGASSTCSEECEDMGGRYNLRQQQQLQQLMSSNEFEGIIHPDSLSEFYEALELVIDTVRTSKNAWPFVDPVPDTVPGYYDLIKEPMDLKKLRTKIEFREYKSLIELEKDFQKLVNNCERFNGPKNVYTKMVFKLWKSFRKNVKLYLQKDLHMDEYETFLYPPQPKHEPEPKLKHEPAPEPMDLDQFHEPQSDYQNSVKQNSRPDSNDSEPTHLIKPEPIPEVELKSNQDIELELKSGPHLEFEEEISEPKAPTPEPITMGEEIIIDSYDVPCPDESFFIWSQETKPT